MALGFPEVQITFQIDDDLIPLSGFSSMGLSILEGFLHLPGGWAETQSPLGQLFLHYLPGNHCSELVFPSLVFSDFLGEDQGASTGHRMCWMCPSLFPSPFPVALDTPSLFSYHC